MSTASPIVSNQEILSAVANGKMSIDEASALLKATPKHSAGPSKPLMRKDGKVHGAKDSRIYRLCRRDANKVPMVYFGVCKAPKGGGYAGSINLAVPALEALVEVHGQNGLFAQALADYRDGSICYSREAV